MVSDLFDDFDQDEVASDTLETLVDLNHPALQDILAEVINHPSRRMRYQAAFRLAEQFQDVRAVPALVEALDDRSVTIRKAAEDALWEIGDADTTGLVALLDSSYGTARERIAAALERIGWQPDDSDSEVTYRIAAWQWRVCVTLGEAAVPALIRRLRDRDGAVRRAAGWALGQIGDARAVTALIHLLGDWEGDLFGEGNRVCDVAADALRQIGTEAALSAVEQWELGS